MGFVSPENDDLFLQSKVKLNSRGNVEANDIDYSTNKRKVFTAGDMRKGTVFSCMGNKRRKTGCRSSK